MTPHGETPVSSQMIWMEGRIAELEAENAALREAVGTMLSRLEQRGFTNDDALFLDLNTTYHAARTK